MGPCLILFGPLIMETTMSVCVSVGFEDVGFQNLADLVLRFANSPSVGERGLPWMKLTKRISSS